MKSENLYSTHPDLLQMYISMFVKNKEIKVISIRFFEEEYYRGIIKFYGCQIIYNEIK